MRGKGEGAPSGSERDGDSAKSEQIWSLMSRSEGRCIVSVIKAHCSVTTYLILGKVQFRRRPFPLDSRRKSAPPSPPWPPLFMYSITFPVSLKEREWRIVLIASKCSPPLRLMRNAAALSFRLDDGGGLVVVAECNHNPRPDSEGTLGACDQLT